MKNTRISRRGFVASNNSVRILSLKFAKRPRNNVLIYTTVQSVSRPDKINHRVSKVGRLYHRTCERSLSAVKSAVIFAVFVGKVDLATGQIEETECRTISCVSHSTT